MKVGIAERQGRGRGERTAQDSARKVASEGRTKRLRHRGHQGNGEMALRNLFDILTDHLMDFEGG